MESFSGPVTTIRDLTPDVRQIDLTLLAPPDIHFAPGQFISFEVDREGSLTPATRPYSIASPPSLSKQIQLVFNRVPGGPGSSYLFSLQEGFDTTFKGPVGSFTLRDSARDILFVATGTASHRYAQCCGRSLVEPQHVESLCFGVFVASATSTIRAS